MGERISGIVTSELPEQEMGLTTDQATEARESPAAQAYAGISPEQRSQIRTNIGQVQVLAARGLTVMEKRQSRIREQRKVLEEQLLEIDQDTLVVNDFFRLMQPASQSDQTVASAVVTTKNLTDRELAEVLELKYRLTLMDIQQDLINQRIVEGQAAIA